MQWFLVKFGVFCQYYVQFLLDGPQAQPVIPPNLYSMFMHIIAWGPQVSTKYSILLSIIYFYVIPD